MTRTSFSGVVRIDAWKQHEWLGAGFSTRLDGQLLFGRTPPAEHVDEA